MGDLLDKHEPLPVTPETVAHLPPASLEDGVNGVAELSAHVAVLSRKGKSMPNAIEPAHSNSRIIRAEDAPMVAMIERIAMDPSIPIDRLEQVLAMKERMEDRAREDDDRAAKRAYFAAMSACQAELPVVVKNQRNSHTKSNYADLAAIEQQAMPVIHSHGFAVSFQPDGFNERGELRVQWEVSHREGHVRNGVGEIPVDGAGSQGKVNKTGTQAFGSTATYGRRYLLCMLFNISTGDDMDGNRPPPDDDFISEDQVKTIRQLLEETESDIEKFCEVGKIEAIPDMPKKDFENAVWLLNQKKSKMAQRVSS